MLYIKIFGTIFLFVLQTLAFFWGARLAGIKHVTMFRSVVAAFLTRLVFLLVDLTSEVISLPMTVTTPLVFITAALVAKNIYKAEINQAFWAGFYFLSATLFLEMLILFVEQKFDIELTVF